MSWKVLIKYSLFDDLRAMVDVTNTIAQIHKKNSDKNARDHELCGKYANLCRLLTIGIPLSYSIVAIGYQLSAFIDIFTKGIVRPSLGIYLPDANQFDVIDMAVLLLTNIIFVATNATILAAADTFACINFLAVPMLSTIVQRQIMDFRNDLTDKKTPNNPKCVKAEIITIIKMQMDYNG